MSVHRVFQEESAILGGGTFLHLNYFNTTKETTVAQWLRCYATNQNVAGSIPDGVIGIFH